MPFKCSYNLRIYCIVVSFLFLFNRPEPEPEMKISIDTLVNILPQDVDMFLDIHNFSPKQLERYISGQFSKFSRLRANVYNLHNAHKISDTEFKEIIDFCDEMIGKCQKIAKNFDLFKNLGVPKPSFSEYNRRVKSLLTK